MSMDLALWVKKKFPDAVEPVFSAMVKADGKLFVRLRDSADDFKLIDAREVPKEILAKLWEV